MARQQEKFTSDPMLPKTILVKQLGSGGSLHTSVSATWMEAAGSVLNLTTGQDVKAADPKATVTLNGTTDTVHLTPGKWLATITANLSANASVADIEFALTDNVDSGSQVVYDQTGAAGATVIAASDDAQVTWQSLFEITAGTDINIRAANTNAAAGTVTVLNSSRALFQKIANVYDS